MNGGRIEFAGDKVVDGRHGAGTVQGVQRDKVFDVFVVLHLVDFKDDKAFREQVDILVRVQQEIITTAFVVLLECRQEVVDIEVRERYLDVTLLHILAVHVPQILIEGIETGRNAVVSTYQLDIRVHGRTKFTSLGLSDMLICTLPERE